MVSIEHASFPAFFLAGDRVSGGNDLIDALKDHMFMMLVAAAAVSRTAVTSRASLPRWL